MPAPQTDSLLSQSFDQSPIGEYFTPLRKPPGRIENIEQLRRRSFTYVERPTPYLGDLRVPGLATPAEIALSTLQYLPYPLLVLNSTKTLILANDAMGKLLGMDQGAHSGGDDMASALDKLKGQNLSQLGIDLLQDMKPVWVNWDSFLESLTNEDKLRLSNGPLTPITPDTLVDEGEITPHASNIDTATSSSPKRTSTVHDSVFEVVISVGDMSSSSFAERKFNVLPPKHVFAKM